MSKRVRAKIFSRSDLNPFTSVREGETKIGQAIQVLESENPDALEISLETLQKNGVQYAIILVPEDIGPRGNLGRPGANEAPLAFLKFFMNMQSNRFLDISKLAIVGEVSVDDLMERSNAADATVDVLRQLCEELDERVATVVGHVARAGIEPIVIGGGNNNSLPTIEGVTTALRQVSTDKELGMAVVNCDPHADFRKLEGRHSGNPFSYAHKRGWLKRYCVLGLHENYNSDDMLSRLEDAGFRYFSYEDFAIKKTVTWEQSIEQVVSYLKDRNMPVGCELDIDGIAHMPSSARTPFGITQEQAAQFISAVASRLDSFYLHLSEGAPQCGSDESMREVGKGLSLMVVTYLKARELYRFHHPTSFGIKRFTGWIKKS